MTHSVAFRVLLVSKELELASMVVLLENGVVVVQAVGCRSLVGSGCQGLSENPRLWRASLELSQAK